MFHFFCKIELYLYKHIRTLIIMSSENEWSDDENEENSVEEKDILDSGGSESEEEFLDYLKQTLAVMNKDDFIYNSNSDIQVKKKNKRKRKKKEKQFILLNFSCDEITAEKKKWRSKRMEAKKKKEGKTSAPKRRFKPRLPKPNIADPLLITATRLPLDV